MSTPEHWQRISRRWNLVGSPLRPIAEDQEQFTRLLELETSPALRGLILGVTPELRTLAWPVGSDLWAVDRSPDMIQAIWTGPQDRAVNGNWLELPWPAEAFDRVLCDGGLHLLQFPGDQMELARSIARVLRTGGTFALRLFALPSAPQTVAQVLADLRDGRIANFHEFKLRMAMALQPDPRTGVILSGVHDEILRACGGDLAHLVDQTGWPADVVGTLESYRDSPNVYHFLTEEESVATLTSQGALRLVGRGVGTYPWAVHCPILLFAKGDD
jgi:SAM-dependent methyltransferase